MAIFKETKTFSSHMQKINLTWIKDPNTELKLQYFFCFGLGKKFLNTTLKVSATKDKKRKYDFTKTKNICASEDIIKKIKDKPLTGIKWIKYFQVKQLVFKIYK
jgi:hypothetical protein